jgi:hypothetical protein
MRPRRQLACIGLPILLYVSGYAVARASHGIVHTSNHRHPHPEKWSPEHHVGSDLCARPGDRAVNLLYKPLRVIEEAFHRLANGQ